MMLSLTNIKSANSGRPVGTILLLLSVGLSFAAHAQPKLTTFTESTGCKLMGNEATVKRLNEIAAQGRGA